MNGPIEFPESLPLKRFIPPNGRGTYGSWVKYHRTRWFGMYTRASAFLTALVLVAVLDPILIPIIDSAQLTRVTNDGRVAPLEGTGFVILLSLMLLISGPTFIFGSVKRMAIEMYGSIEAANDSTERVLRALRSAVESGGVDGPVSVREISGRHLAHSKAARRRIVFESIGFGVVLLVAFFLIGRLVTAPIARLILIVVVGMAISRFSRGRMRAHTGGVPLFVPRAHPHPHETPDGWPENESGPDPDDEPDDRSKR